MDFKDQDDEVEKKLLICLYIKKNEWKISHNLIKFSSIDPRIKIASYGRYNCWWIKELDLIRLNTSQPLEMASCHQHIFILQLKPQIFTTKAKHIKNKSDAKKILDVKIIVLKSFIANNVWHDQLQSNNIHSKTYAPWFYFCGRAKLSIPSEMNSITSICNWQDMTNNTWKHTNT